QQRPRQRRPPRDARVAGIEFVDADDRHLALVAAFVADRHGRAEVHPLMRPARIVDDRRLVERLRYIANPLVDLAQLALAVDVVAVFRTIAVARGPRHGRDERRPVLLPEPRKLLLQTAIAARG